MKLSILSDLHLDFSNYSVDPTVFNSDAIIIAGDLASDHDLVEGFFSKLTYQTNLPIIYVMGNHEYDLKNINNAIKNIRRICEQFPTVHFLENDSFILNNVKFIGATLWTNFLYEGEAFYKLNTDFFLQSINNYYFIDPKDNISKPVTIKFIEDKFYETEKFIKFHLNEPFKGKKAVITHFAPMVKNRDPKYDKFLSSFWINDLEPLVEKSDLWVHGHLHSSFDYKVEDARVICNPRGYSRFYNIAENTNFVHNKMIVL